jgi:hypothetical protein
MDLQQWVQLPAAKMKTPVCGGDGGGYENGNDDRGSAHARRELTLWATTTLGELELLGPDTLSGNYDGRVQTSRTPHEQVILVPHHQQA